MSDEDINEAIANLQALIAQLQGMLGGGSVQPMGGGNGTIKPPGG